MRGDAVLRTADEIDRALIAAGDRAAAVELAGDLHTDKNNKTAEIADIVAHVMLPDHEVDLSAMKSWIWRALRESVTVTPVVRAPDGRPLIELEARPSTIPGLTLRRWIVRDGAEPLIRGLQLRDTSRTDRFVVLHRSTKPGYDEWQASWFDDRGAGGDLSARTLEKAMMDGASPSHHTIETADIVGQESGMPRDNPARDAHASKAAAMFARFHTRDWRAEGTFHPSMVIPGELRCLGDVLNTDYQSDKLHPGTGEDEGWIDYTHKHDGGVKIYAPVGARHPGDVDVVRTPAAVARVDQMTWLGKYLGGSYRAGGRVLEVRGTEPLPELFAAPSGKALYVVQGKRSLLFVIWGGRLAVEHRGIVH